MNFAGLPRGSTILLTAALVAIMAWPGWIRAVGGSSAGPVSPEVLGRGRLIYQANCAVCHGVSGDGRGMAAHMFRVQPRDFRRGLFKFRSTPSGALPSDEDLARTIIEGIRWTGMVGRPDLTVPDRMAVVQHLKTFSPRFTTERPAASITVPPAPARTPERVARGRELYRDADCASCHGERGRGDGPSAPGERDDWGWATWPSDLTWRPLKRGSGPENLYLTIATGLSGTPMPSYGDALDGEAIWDLVHYLDTLVPADHRLLSVRALGEESRGWMALRMGWMMGGMMGRGMMPRMPTMP
jgi:cytochrome c oxidase cbb3-type subunit 2